MYALLENQCILKKKTYITNLCDKRIEWKYRNDTNE